MRFRRSHSILLILLAVFIGAQSDNRAQDTEKKLTSNRTVIFAVSGGDGINIDPIVIIDRGRFVKPPEGIDKEAGHFRDTPQSLKFAAEYYRAGHTYQLLFGGGKIGTAAVTKRTSITGAPLRSS